MMPIADRLKMDTEKICHWQNLYYILSSIWSRTGRFQLR